MHNCRCFRIEMVRNLLLSGVLVCAGWAQAQSRHMPTAPAPPSGVVQPALVDERILDDIHQQLVKLLRITPQLTGAVTHDPSLLSDQQYVARSNPALAHFLELHPEVARNPEFYLFAKVNDDDRGEGLRREVWPELIRDDRPSPGMQVAREIGPPLTFIAVFIALIWLIRVFLENSRWRRTLKAQTELQGKLLDKFAANQELIAYLDSEGGKQLLQLSATPVMEETARWSGGMFGRMLTPLQFGAVLIPIGIGFSILHYIFQNEAGLVVVSTLALTLGIGLCAAAIVSWLLARRYGLLPQTAEEAGYRSHERQ